METQPMTAVGSEFPHDDVTRALRAAQAREPGAGDRLFGLVQGELRARVARLRTGVRREVCSQTTSLVDDAFLRLNAERVTWQNRDHYLGVATLMVQRMILDLARRQQRRKRGGGEPSLGLPDDLTDLLPDPDFVLDLQAALERLGALRPRWRRIAELRAFGGLDNRTIAATLGVSLSTVEHDWAFVRAWLHRELA
jgi:RNA polymerase sigma factor (TIGR02999 family)